MADHADIVREWILDSPYALAALDALVAERDEAKRKLDNAIRVGLDWLTLAAQDTVRAEAAEARVKELEEVLRTGGLLRNDLVAEVAGLRDALETLADMPYLVSEAEVSQYKATARAALAEGEIP